MNTWGHMRLSKLYSNKPDVFEPIAFRDGLNVVFGEIRVPENRNLDTHNLGKTTLGRLIDFCLLAKRDPQFFLFKHKEVFSAFTFFLEIRLLDGTFVTVRRAVEDSSKIHFKRHDEGKADFSSLPESQWDHSRIPLEKAQTLLDGLLDLRALKKPWTYRKGLGYSVRSQQDYLEVFQLQKFAGKHADWKPFLADLLGFNGKLSADLYEKENQINEKEHEIAVLKRELPFDIDDSKLDGILALKRDEQQKKQRELDVFDFGEHDKETTQKLVSDIDAQIADLNEKRYYLRSNEKKVIAALKDDKILFDPREAEVLFKEAGVVFGGQIKKDFEQLIAFNKAITVERRAYLEEEQRELAEQINGIDSKLESLSKQRSRALAFLSSADSFDKYKRLSTEVVNLRADITVIERQRQQQQRIAALQREARALQEEKDHLTTQVEEDVEQQRRPDATGRFTTIRSYFNEIIKEVIDRRALLNVKVNKEGHLEFKAEILDDAGRTTSADMGRTYRKLLCMAFDMAVTRAYLGEHFSRFLFHDGVFEALDDRKKHNLIRVMRQYAAFGVQHMITLIDSEMPQPELPGKAVFEEAEVVLRLHDQGRDGRLFKMEEW